MMAAQPDRNAMRYSRLNQGCSQKGSRRSRAHWVSGAPPAQSQRRNFTNNDIMTNDDGWLAGRLARL